MSNWPDQAAGALDADTQALGRLLALWGTATVLQHIALRADDGQRRAQFMGGIGQEVAFALQQLPQPCQRGIEFVHHGRQLGMRRADRQRLQVPGRALCQFPRQLAQRPQPRVHREPDRQQHQGEGDQQGLEQAFAADHDRVEVQAPAVVRLGHLDAVAAVGAVLPVDPVRLGAALVGIAVRSVRQGIGPGAAARKPPPLGIPHLKAQKAHGVVEQFGIALDACVQAFECRCEARLVAGGSAGQAVDAARQGEHFAVEAARLLGIDHAVPEQVDGRPDQRTGQQQRQQQAPGDGRAQQGRCPQPHGCSPAMR